MDIKWMIVALSLCGWAGEGDWPQFRGAGYDGCAQAPGLFEQGIGIQTSWRQPLGDGYSSVTISEGVAVALYGDGTHDMAVAFETSNGTPRWRVEIGEAYQGYGGSYDGPVATPAIDDGRVYLIGPKGRLLALDLKTGKKEFELDLQQMGAPEPTYGFTSSPFVVGETLVVHIGSEETGLMGLDKRSGKKKWTSTPVPLGYQTANLVTLFGKQQLLLGAEEKVMGIDPTNGAELWSYATGIKSDCHMVMTGENRFYVSPIHFNDGGMMLRATQTEDGVHIEKVWQNEEIGKAMSIPIYYQGYLYGYNGRFLSCVDASNGKRMWKSRPPGPGFHILVEDHLAVVTQKGDLYLIEATSEAYREKASQHLFDEVVYTIPSFADGKLFLRSQAAIAALELDASVKQEQTQTTVGQIPESTFAKTLAKLAASENPEAAVASFLAQQERFPIFEGDGMVHLLYHGEAEDVGVFVSALDYTREYPMHRLEGTQLYSFSLELEPTAHVSYVFNVDYGTRVLDPRNPAKGYGYWGEREWSTLAMPRFEDSDHLAEPKRAGRIEEHSFESAATGLERKFKVYLPPGYEQSNKRYPVLYTDYGFAALEAGLMDHTLANLSGKIQDPIVVFVPPQPRVRSERDLEPGKKYADMMAKELVPMIDGTYRTLATRENRALLGHLWMAFATLYTGLHHADQFGKVAIQSGLFDKEFEQTLLSEADPAKQPKLHFEWGSYDFKNDMRREIPVLNHRFVALLQKKGIEVQTQELPMSDGWDHWRTRQDELLNWLFPLNQ